MHAPISLSMLISLAVSQSLILEAQNGTCGYLNGMKLASYGCQATTQKCAISYPTSPPAADITVVPTNPAIPKTLTPRAVNGHTMVITSAPQADYPVLLCCNPSNGDCAAQPTACVDALEHPHSALYTGSCLNDPMTLKCTAGHSSHCNRIELQLPLYYQRRVDSNDGIGGLDAGMGFVQEPVRGWFCGASALPTTPIESTITSRRTISEDASLLSTAVTIPHDDDQHGTEAHSVSPLTTASYTITFTKHLGTQISAAPSLNPGPQVGPEGYSYEPDATIGEDCCIDEPLSGEECCIDDIARQALQRRRDPEVHEVGVTDLTTVVTSPSQLVVVTTTATPAAAPAMTITEGLAILSTAYANQSDPTYFVEATRS